MAKKMGKSKLKKIARFHLFFSGALFFLYLLLSLIYSPEFLLSDIRQKYHALADELLVITATVLGPPQKPVVSGEAVCANGNLHVALDWADDANSTSFDVERDSAPLVSGLAASQYDDSVVVVGTSYTYVVTANGPMGPGSEVSDPISVTTSAECLVPLPTPEISVVSFDGKNVSSFEGTPSTTNRRPIFTGTTNIPNANISLLLPSSANISAQIVANANGYWSWRPPISVDIGRQNLFIQAIDPNDPGRSISITFGFQIKKKTEEEEKEAKKTTTVVSPPVIPVKKPVETPIISQPEGSPLEFSLSLKKESVFQGKELETTIKIDRLESAYEDMDVVIRYTIFNEKGEKMDSFLKEVTLHVNRIIPMNIPIPKYFFGGKYQIQAEIMLEQHNLSQTKPFSVLELPVLNLGGGFLVTYAQFLSQLGSIASWLLFLLFLWLILFSREYWLYLHSLRHITERNLERIGFFGPGRGKGVSS